MQILNFNRISIKNRGQTCNVPFHNFCTRGNFPNTGIFLFTLKRFAPNFQNSSLRMFDTNVLVPSPFFEIRSNDFITVKKGGRRGIACARGGRKCTTRTFLLFPPPPPPPKMIGNLKLLFVSGGKQGGLAHFFEAPPAFTRLNKRCFHDNSAHPLASPLRIPRIPKNPCSLISSNSLAWVDKWVS